MRRPVTGRIHRTGTVIDALYVIGTLAFFGAMLGYVALCERLGRSHAPTEADRDSR